MARLYLNDKRSELIKGIIFIVIGATFIAFYSDLSPNHLSYHKFIKLFKQPLNEIYLILQATIIFTAIFVGHFWESKSANRFSNDSTPLLITTNNDKRVNVGPAVIFASISGTLSGFCLLLAKGGVDILGSIINNGKWSTLLHIQIWLLIITLILAAVFQVSIHTYINLVN